MSVKKEDNGRRSVQVEFDVKGTPEEVWQAIATGPGISAWFVPTEFEMRDGKPVAMTYKFAPGVEPRAEITEWNPPHKFAGQGEVYGGSPPVASEWTVEAKAGGVCRIRIVHSLFASTDEWDNQLEGANVGWSGFLAILRVYLAHFRGMRSALMQITAPVATSDAESWEALTTAIGVKGLRAGARWSAPAGASPLSGVVEYLSEDPYDVLMRLDKPGPGIAVLGAATYPGGQSVVAMNLYMYGDDATDAVKRETPRWEAWFRERFPTPATD